MQDMVNLKGQLSMLLGSSRSLEGVQLAYGHMPAVRPSSVLPDYYLRQAEQALKLVLAICKSGSNGMDWGFPTCQTLKPLLIPPKGTDDLR